MMKNDSECRIVIIGMGFLMGYISPCYENFLADGELAEQVAAVTADEKSLEEKRSQFPFEIVLNDNLSTLRKLNPDIILFATPPSVAPRLAENVLKPYFDEVRSAGEVLPDLYCFPPTPHGKYYLDLLGEDIQVCNILPNMVKEINGQGLKGKEGNTYITYPDEAPWPSEKLKRIERFFAPLGKVVEVKPGHIMEVLSTLVATDVMPHTIYTVFDALDSSGNNVPYWDVATLFRNRLHDIRPELPADRNRLTAEVSPEIKNTIGMYCEAWYDGLCDYLAEKGVEDKSIHKIVSRKLDIALHACQEESRSTIEHNAKNHATPDGVLEKGHFIFEVLIKDRLFNTIVSLTTSEPDDEFYDWVYSMARELSKIVTEKGRQLAGGLPPAAFTAEIHAALFGIITRNAIKHSGEKGRSAIEEGVILYGKQRGGRMAGRALENDDELTMLNYMAYGEWKPEEGQFDIRETTAVPSAVTRVYKCPWQVTWKKLGFMEEGRLYCKHVDRNLAIGFNENIDLGINSLQMEGDEYCEFVYNGAVLTDENRKILGEKKAALGDSTIRDWEYHSMHLFKALGSVLRENVENADEILEKSLKDFTMVFGRHAGEVLEKADAVDFTKI